MKESFIRLFFNRLSLMIKMFLLFTTAGAAGRVLFYVIYRSHIATGGETSFWGSLYHGLRLDTAVAGYFSVIPLMLVIVSTWMIGRKKNTILQWTWKVYIAVISVLLTIALVANIMLYKYWGFPLDTTALTYFISSPKDALASAEIWQLAVGLGSLLLIGAALYRFFTMARFLPRKSIRASRSAKSLTTLGILVWGAVLFLFIRGGVSESTNNVGSVYFSENVILNHSAVNPVFSFMESAAHENDFASQYRFMSNEEATRLFAPMTYTKMRKDYREAYSIANKPGTHIVFVVLESFSKYIMGETGHVKGITPNLDKLTGEGLYFTNFYANSFRTDRGLVAILSGYPAQPTMSLMKYPRLTNNLYSIARSLGADGFNTHYIYGGDANFTNMRSYLLATGFETLIGSGEFKKEELTSKWGANDSIVFRRALSVMSETRTAENKTFTVVQTLSSHEPFDVPYHNHDNKQLNAFQYTDRELGLFVDAMKKRDDWKNTLLVIVPDHLGCYPVDIDNYTSERYQIPLIMTGGLVKERQHIATYGSQQDIAATLLAMLGIRHDEFTFSKDMFDSAAPHFAFYTYPDAVGMTDTENSTMIDNKSGRVLFDIGKKRGANRDKARAYLQKLYDDIASR